MMKYKKINGTNAAWITWEIQVRNRSMANALNVPLYELTSTKARFLKYPFLIVSTLQVLLKNQIRVVFVQNPSIVLSFLAVCLKPVLRLSVIVDAHNSGIYPLGGANRVLNYFARFICRNANLVIVTNSYLSKVVEHWGGKSFVMPDPIPDFSTHKPSAFETKRPFILFICTWADDEPYMEVIEAASSLQAYDLDIFITGSFKKRLSSVQINNIPKNVTLLGFISENDYINHLIHAITVMDLTTRDNCLVCGAYEAAATETPAILSDTKVNREVFDAGYLYTKNTAPTIAAAIVDSVSRQTELRVQLVDFKARHKRLIARRITELTEIMISD